jgi:hypothetical protein
VRLLENRHNQAEDLLENSKPTKYSYEEDHGISWNEARISGIGNTS